MQALELDPDFSEAYEYLALLATRTGDLRAAVGYYQQALERLTAEDPKLPVLYSNLAQIYLRLKEFGSAAGQFEQVVALAPESEQAAQARRWLEALEKQGLKPPGSPVEDDNESSAPPVSGFGAG
jgi:tetratricopeptide (TPR) repeat protein